MWSFYQRGVIRSHDNRGSSLNACSSPRPLSKRWLLPRTRQTPLRTEPGCPVDVLAIGIHPIGTHAGRLRTSIHFRYLDQSFAGDQMRHRPGSSIEDDRPDLSSKPEDDEQCAGHDRAKKVRLMTSARSENAAMASVCRMCVVTPKARAPGGGESDSTCAFSTTGRRLAGLPTAGAKRKRLRSSARTATVEILRSRWTTSKRRARRASPRRPVDDVATPTDMAGHGAEVDVFEIGLHGFELRARRFLGVNVHDGASGQQPGGDHREVTLDVRQFGLEHAPLPDAGSRH
jgi:hypothetical protein